MFVFQIAQKVGKKPKTVLDDKNNLFSDSVKSEASTGEISNEKLEPIKGTNNPFSTPEKLRGSTGALGKEIKTKEVADQVIDLLRGKVSEEEANQLTKHAEKGDWKAFNKLLNELLEKYKIKDKFWREYNRLMERGDFQKNSSVKSEGLDLTGDLNASGANQYIDPDGVQEENQTGESEADADKALHPEHYDKA